MKIENQDILANEKIPFFEIQLVDENGENKGIVKKEDAIRYAKEKDLDVVIVAKAGSMKAPVAKIMNLNKKLYEDKKKVTKAKKKQSEVQTKELRVSPKIGDHDLGIKCKQAVGFLSEGNRVRFVLVLKGREKSLKDTFGVIVFEKIEGLLHDGFVDCKKTVAWEPDGESASSWAKIFYLKK
jgi:translation initiation factor IF-3